MFDITIAKDRVDLSAQGEGRALFTVSNSSGATARGRAKVVPPDPLQQGWYSIEGDPERTLRADQTTQYTVRVLIPPGTARGEYSLRLDMVATDASDEAYDEGPRVLVPCAGTSEAPRKPFPRWILLIAGAVVLVAGGASVAWILARGPRGSEMILVPEVVGQSFEDAKKAMERAGLQGRKWGGAIARGTWEINQVMEQDPSGHVFLPKGEIVLLTLGASESWVPVPDVVGDSLAVAKTTLANFTVERGALVIASDKAPNTIVGQRPSAGGSLQQGAAITLDYTVGSTVRAPLLIGKVLDASLARSLQRSGLYVMCLWEETSEHRPNEIKAALCLNTGQKLTAEADVPTGSIIFLGIARPPSIEDHQRVIDTLLWTHKLVPRRWFDAPPEEQPGPPPG